MTLASTKEKMNALAAELRETAIEDTSPETRGLVEVVQIASGFGIDVFQWLVPGDEAECDVFIDQLIALLVRVRGDDLPPFTPDLYGEARTARPARFVIELQEEPPAGLSEAIIDSIGRELRDLETNREGIDGFSVTYEPAVA